MIPILEEQSERREPFFEIKAAWGGDFALEDGLVGCTATASSAAGSYPASKSNDGDKTVLNDSWWESTKVGGKAFYKTTDGYVFHDDFEDFTNWSAKLTDGAATSDSSTADSPWARFAVKSNSPGSSAYVFRRSTNTYAFSSERIYSFALDIPSCRSYSDSQYNDISFILCPTSVSTSPVLENNWLSISLQATNEGIEIIVGKNVATSYTDIYRSEELTTLKKLSNFRLIIDSTNISVWHEDLGYIIDNVAHGLSFTTPYIYLQLENISGDIREGSVGYLSIYKGTTQTVNNLTDSMKISLTGTEFQNTTFERSAIYATQDYIEDFEKYALDDVPFDWIVDDDGGTSALLIKSLGGSKSLQLSNDSLALTWSLYNQRTFYDFEYLSTLYIPSPAPTSGLYPTTLFKDTFTDTNGTLLKNHTPEINYTGDVWHDVNDQWQIQSNELVQSGTDLYTTFIDLGETDYTFTGRLYINSAASFSTKIMVRSNATNYLYFHIHSNSSGTIWVRNQAHTILATDTSWTISTGWKDFSIRITSAYIEITLDGTTLRYTSTTYNSQTGMGMWSWGGAAPKYEDFLITTTVSETRGKLSQLVRCASDFSATYHLQHDIVNDKFNLLKGSAGGVDPGWITRSFLFDGINDWINFTNNSVYNIAGNDATFSVWMKNSNIAANIVFINRGLFGGNGFYIQTFAGNMEVVQGAIQMTRTNGGLAGTQNVWTLWTFKKIGGEKWHIYKNGIELSYLIQNTSDPTSSTDPLVVGCYGSGVSNFYTGNMCDFRWHNRALSDTEIADIANTIPTDLIGWWRFDESSGATAADSSTTGQDGTINNANPAFYSALIPYIVPTLQILLSQAYTYTLGSRTHIRAILEDENIKCWIDDTQVCNYTDTGTTILSGKLGLQLDCSAAYSIGFDNIITHAASLPSFWRSYSNDYGFVIQQTQDYIYYPELFLTRTSADATDFSWVEISDATSSTDGQFYGENHRGGYLSSDCSSVGTPAGSSSVNAQTTTYTYRTTNLGKIYFGVHHIADSDGGKYELWFGSTLIGTIDTYNATKTYEWVQVGTYYDIQGAPASWTITLKKIGTKNASSTDYWVRILEIGVFWSADDIPTTSITKAFSEGQSKTNINDPKTSAMMIADIVMSGKECGIKQEVTFPKGQTTYLTAIVSTDKAGTIVSMDESITGTGTSVTLTNAHQDYTISLARTNIDGGVGDVGLYISSVPTRTISRVYVKDFSVLGGSTGSEKLTHVKAPYTTSSPALTGTAPEYLYSNLLLSSELFESPEWYHYGTITFDSSEYVNPYDAGILNAEKITFGSTSYIYQPVDYDYKDKILTFSIWLKADSATNIYIGLLEDFENPVGDQLISVDVTTTWQRYSITVNSAILNSTTVLNNTLYAYIGTSGLAVLADLSSTTVYAWGAQVAESSDICRYYPRANTELLQNNVNFTLSPWTDTGNITIYDDTSLTSFIFDSITYSENFESYAIGYDLTSGDWTQHNYDATTPTFIVQEGKVGVGQVEAATRCSYRYSTVPSLAWDNYEFKFTLSRQLDNNELLGMNFRWTAAGGYTLIYDPSASLFRLYSSTSEDLTTTQTLVANWDGSIPTEINNARLVIKETTFEIYIDGILLGTYTGLTHAAGSVGFTFGNTDDTADESIAVDDLELHQYTIANKIDLTAAGVATNTANYDTGVVLTARRFETSMWLRAFDGEGDIYLILEDNSSSQASVRKISLNKDWKKVVISRLFTTTTDTDMNILLSTAAYGTYGALADISIEAWGSTLYEQTIATDHAEIWEGTQNLILRSEEFNHASWVKHATTTVTADQYVNPLFSNQDADKIVNVTAGHGVYQAESVVAPASNTFTFSVWVRADVDTEFYLEINDDPGAQAFQDEFTAKPYWQRFEFTATFVASAQASTLCELRAKNASSTLYAWGAQCEQKSYYATKYEQTVAATTTRSATRLNYTTPTALDGVDKAWAVTMRMSLLADSYAANREHVLFTLGAYSTAVDNTAKVYIENGLLKLDGIDDNSVAFSQEITLPTDLELYSEYVIGITREESLWSIFLLTKDNEYSSTVDDTGFDFPSNYYVGCLDDNSLHGNIRVSDFTIYSTTLGESEIQDIVDSTYNTQYDLFNNIHAIIPFRDTTDSYRSGGSVVFDLGISTSYPLAIEWNLWEFDEQKLLESDFLIYGGSVWEWNPDWLVLTFDSEITFNRLNLYAFPNETSSLQTPYEVGKGGLKAWTLEYWNSTLNIWKSFYRKTGSETDLDIIDLTQLCTNGIFEEGLTDWVETNSDYVILSQDSTEYLTGLHSMKVEIYNPPVISQGPKYATTFLPENTYTVTGWAKGTGSIRVEVYDGYEWHYGTTTVLSPSDWEKLTVTFTVNEDTVVGSSFAQFVTSVAGSTSATFNLDEVTIIPTVQTSITTEKIRLIVQDVQVEDDVVRVVALQVLNYINESARVKENNVNITYRKTPETNFISPGQFQVVLTNLDERYSPKNSNSPIYGVSQIDGRGYVRAGTPIEILGGYVTTGNDYFKSPLMKGTIGSEQNPAANTGIEIDTEEQTVTLIGGDNLTQLERTIIEDYNILDGLSYEEVLTYLCQIAGFAIQDMQFDESGVSIPYTWFGGNVSILTLINKIVEASDGAFFDHPSQLKKSLFFYDGVKFKSWLQTTKDDFDAGVLTNVSTTVSSGNVELIQGNQSNNMLSWDSNTNTDSNYWFSQLALYNATTYPYSTLNVKDYHFESEISNNWDYQLALNSLIFRYTNGAVGIDASNRCAAQSFDGSSRSILGFVNLDQGTEPKMIVELVGEDNSILSSTEHRIYNSGQGYEVVTDLENGVIPNPSTASTVASYTIRFRVTTTVNPGQYIYVYFPVQTTVANGSWGVEAGGGAPIAGITIDGANAAQWFATESAYSKLSMKLGIGSFVYPGEHTMVIDSAVVNTITNPAVVGSSYKLYIGTTHENYLWSSNYKIGFDNGIGPGTYYFARERRYSTGSGVAYGAMTGRSDAFVVAAGTRRIPKVVHWGGGSSDLNWNADRIFWQVNPANPDDALYYPYSASAPPNWEYVIHGAPVSGDNKYYVSGKSSGASTKTDGWNIIDYYNYAIASQLNISEQKLKLRLKFKGQNNQYSYIQTKEFFHFNKFIPRFYMRVMQFEDTILIDSIKYGAFRCPTSGDAVTDSFDTSDTAPNFGDVTIALARNLDTSKAERVRIYSQSSDDDATWYGLGGLNQWDELIDLQLGNSAFGRIVSPSKRYVRFKVLQDSADTYYTPILSSLSFKYTNDGNIVSQVLDATSTINKWGIFQSNKTLTDYGTITYETLSSDDVGFTQTDPDGWQSATPGALITSAVKRYLKWRANLSTSYGEYTPSLHDVTINWEKGLIIPSELRSYSYDNRLLTFVPKSGNPVCNKSVGLANFYIVDPSIVTNSVTAFWNGGGSSAKTCGAEVASFPELPLAVDNTTKIIVFEASDPTITPNTSIYSTYPRAFVVTIGATNYGVFGWDVGASQEGTQFSFLAGALKLTFSGTAKRVTVTIVTTAPTSLADIKLYGYYIKKAGDLEPPLLTTTTNEDIPSQDLYNHIFLKQVDNEYITSEDAASVLTQLIVDEGKFVRDYGQIRIPIAFSLNLQTKFVVTQPNANWDNQSAEPFEIQHNGSDWTTTISIKEK
jgi:hypothetical protein